MVSLQKNMKRKQVQAVPWRFRSNNSLSISIESENYVVELSNYGHEVQKSSQGWHSSKNILSVIVKNLHYFILKSLKGLTRIFYCIYSRTILNIASLLLKWNAHKSKKAWIYSTLKDVARYLTYPSICKLQSDSQTQLELVSLRLLAS